MRHALRMELAGFNRDQGALPSSHAIDADDQR
jgi:hypothetical protein